MNGWTNEITVDLAIGSPGLRLQTVFEGDEKANVWIVHVKSNGEDVNLTGFSGKAVFIRSDGQTVDVVGTISGNTVTVELNAGCYARCGELRGVILIENQNQNQTITLDALNLIVKRKRTDYAVPSDDRLVTLGSGSLSTNAQTIIGAINELYSDTRIVFASNADIDTIFA